jgi:signal transduction histidine kinase
VVAVEAGTVLHQSAGAVHDIWFPIDCVASLSTALQNGSEAEVALIGCEGMVGISPVLGGTDTTWNEAAVQIGGEAVRIPLHRFRAEVARNGRLRLLLQRFAQALLVQTSQTAACNRFHSIEQRLARCLLAMHDRMPEDEIPVTHERLAAMLGSLRPGVTLAAQHLQSQGIIRYSRGKIEVVGRALLENAACECYAAVVSEYERLLGAAARAQLTAATVLTDDTLREVNSRLIIAAIREQRAREAAEAENDVNTRFFATLSHELRMPLTAILGWSDLLQSGGLDDDTLKLAIETIHRNAEAQKRLVNDMLDVARLRSGSIRLELQPVDLTAAVQQAVATARPMADGGSIAISVIAGDPVLVDADPLRLQQILGNLLANAVKFTPPGGSIQVTIKAVRSHVQIAVTDSGRGIEPELLPEVFDDFRHGAAAPSGELGMGLGLAIVRQLVTLHGGTVQVQSAGAGAGATFTIAVPRPYLAVTAPYSSSTAR